MQAKGSMLEEMLKNLLLQTLYELSRKALLVKVLNARAEMSLHLSPSDNDTCDYIYISAFHNQFIKQGLCIQNLSVVGIYFLKQ